MRGADADRQDEIIAYLSQAEHWGVAAADFDVCETHIAIVFLVGASAYKMKKSVDLGYLDYSTQERRRHCLERELRFNAPNAPGLYRRVVPVTGANDGYEVNGTGRPLEWLLEMDRFDQADMLSARAAAGALDETLAVPLARTVAGLHAGAARCRTRGWRDAVNRIVRSSEALLFKAARIGLVPERQVALYTDRTDERVHEHREHLEARARGGRVRRCHGDLHLSNIVLRDGRPVPFDCIEFSDDIACIDTLYDLAFLLMDLRFRGLPVFASRLFNAYLAELPQREFEATLEALALLPLYMSMRAGIRGHVTAQRVSLASTPLSQGDVEALSAEAGRYVSLAIECLRDPVPRVIAVGGLSGTGKSTLALSLAPLLDSVAGAVVLRSDEVRKRHFGVAMDEALPHEAYTPEVGAMIYKMLEEEARLVVTAGQPVILDAVFAQPFQRQAAARLAAECGVPFNGFWLEADPEILRARVAARTGDASDATVSVLETQLGYDLGAITWDRLDAGGGREDLKAAVIRRLHPS